MQPTLQASLLTFAVSACAIALGACSSEQLPESLIDSVPAASSPLSVDSEKLSTEQIETRTWCDAARVNLRRQIIQEWQLEKVAVEAREVSYEFYPDEIEDMKKLVSDSIFWISLKRDTEQKKFYNEMIETLEQIYSEAVQRAGFLKGSGYMLEPEKRWYTFAGISPVIGTCSNSFELVHVSVRETPVVGQILDIRFMATPDQSRYFISVAKIVEVNAGGYKSIYTSLMKYVDEKLPSECNNIKTTLDETRFNSMIGI